MNLRGLPYRLLPMCSADIPTVAVIERNVFSLPWSTTAFRYELKHNSASEYLVLRHQPLSEAQDGGQPIAASVRRILQPRRPDAAIVGYGGYWLMLGECHICTLAVRPDWRGRGLGELVLAELINAGLRRGAEVITLEVRVSNTVAINLYKKYGFVIVGLRKRYYSDNGEDAHIMTTDLTASDTFITRFARFKTALRQRLLDDLAVTAAKEPARTSRDEPGASRESHLQSVEKHS